MMPIASQLTRAIGHALSPGEGGASGPTPSFSADLATVGTLSGFTVDVGLTMMRDAADGVFKYAPHNLVTSDLSNLTVSGGVTWDGLVLESSGSGVGYRGITESALPNPGVPVAFSVEAKAHGSSSWFYFNNTDGVGLAWFNAADGSVGASGSHYETPTAESLGDGWYRFTAIGLASTIWRAYLAQGDGSNVTPASGDGVQLRKPMRYAVPMVNSDTYPGDMSAPYYAARTGSYPFGSDVGCTVEAKSRTNLLPNSDITQWSGNSHEGRAASSATGISEAVDAIDLTDSNASSARGTWENVTITNNGNVVSAKTWVYNDGDTSVFPSVELRLSGGTTQTQRITLNKSTGAAHEDDSDGAYTITTKTYGSEEWHEVKLAIVNNSSGNTTARLRVLGASAETSVDAGQESSATGTSTFWSGEIYQTDTTSTATAIAQIKGSSPVVTAGATVTQDGDGISRSNPFGTDDAVVCHFASPSDPEANTSIIWRANLGVRLIRNGAAGEQVRFTDATNNIDANVAFDGTLQKTAAAWDSTNGLRLSVNGGAVQSASFTGADQGALGGIGLGVHSNGTLVPWTGPLLIAKYDEFSPGSALADADLESEAT